MYIVTCKEYILSCEIYIYVYVTTVKYFIYFILFGIFYFQRNSRSFFFKISPKKTHQDHSVTANYIDKKIMILLLKYVNHKEIQKTTYANYMQHFLENNNHWHLSVSRNHTFAPVVKHLLWLS